MWGREGEVEERMERPEKEDKKSGRKRKDVKVFSKTAGGLLEKRKKTEEGEEEQEEEEESPRVRRRKKAKKTSGAESQQTNTREKKNHGLKLETFFCQCGNGSLFGPLAAVLRNLEANLAKC